jgi:hypothetical protein
MALATQRCQEDAFWASPDHASAPIDVCSGSWLCENLSKDRSGARLIQTECRSPHERFARAADLILLLRADDYFQRFHTARVRRRHSGATSMWPLSVEQRTTCCTAELSG